MRRLFLSDVHLSPREPGRTERLLRFLRREAPRADEIYILGDLFDYWIGPKHLGLPDYREALEALRDAARGRAVFFLIGNRDFYMRCGFEEATGIRVVPGRTEHRMTAGSRQMCLCHGDYLEGRTDRGFRIQEWIRSEGFERKFIRLPACIAKAMAGFYRWLSSRKPRRSCRVSEAVLEAECRKGTDVIVCGHFHKPEMRTIEAGGRRMALFVLGDWSGGESYLVEDDGRWELQDGPAAGP
jgi:UDP-2,3-diacylglucosamine hydrolase